MKIRFAKSSDRDSVLLLLNELGEIINTYVAYDPKNIQAHKYGVRNYNKVMRSKHVKIFVMEKNKKIIGVASFFIITDMITGEKFAHIDDFVIRKSQRNGMELRL